MVLKEILDEEQAIGELRCKVERLKTQILVSEYSRQVQLCQEIDATIALIEKKRDHIRMILDRKACESRDAQDIGFRKFGG